MAAPENPLDGLSGDDFIAELVRAMAEATDRSRSTPADINMIAILALEKRVAALEAALPSEVRKYLERALERSEYVGD